jgi:hypothetical protein
MPNDEHAMRRPRRARAVIITAIAILFQIVGTLAVLIPGVFVLIWVGFRATAPPSVEPAGSGIVVRTDVTAIWVPHAFLDVAQGKAGSPVIRSPEGLRTELERHGVNAAWYAVAYRSYQVNGDSVETAQVRRMTEASAHIEEFQDVMACAAGNPPRDAGSDFSHVMVGIIPDTRQSADPIKAVAKLMAQPAAGERTGALASRGSHPPDNDSR